MPSTGLTSQIFSFTSAICSLIATNCACRPTSRRTFSTSPAASCRPTVPRPRAVRVLPRAVGTGSWTVYHGDAAGTGLRRESPPSTPRSGRGRHPISTARFTASPSCSRGGSTWPRRTTWCTRSRPALARSSGPRISARTCPRDRCPAATLSDRRDQPRRRSGRAGQPGDDRRDGQGRQHHRPGRAGDRRRPRTDQRMAAIRPSGR